MFAVVIKVGEALNVTIKPDDIDISHKINHGKVILVKFVSHKVKSKLYKERTKLKNVKINDLFPSYPSRPGIHRIYLNENLTAYTKTILEEANRRKRDGTLLSVWTLDGKIFGKTSPSGSPIKILSEEDLDNL